MLGGLASGAVLGHLHGTTLLHAFECQMAMGAFQPHHTVMRSPDGIPRGSVYGFRGVHWFEHLGNQEEVFEKPWTKECMRRVNELAGRYWEEFSRPEPIEDMHGHLMRYPYTIKEDGTIGSIPGHEHYPDSNGRILGGKRPTYPRILTV